MSEIFSKEWWEEDEANYKEVIKSWSQVDGGWSTLNAGNLDNMRIIAFMNFATDEITRLRGYVKKLSEATDSPKGGRPS